jgi:hypothetical protein
MADKITFDSMIGTSPYIKQFSVFGLKQVKAKSKLPMPNVKQPRNQLLTRPRTKAERPTDLQHIAI